MARIPLEIPSQDGENIDFSKPPSILESLGAHVVLGWDSSAIGTISRRVGREVELLHDNSSVLSPDELNKKYPDMETPFNEPTSEMKAKLLYDETRRRHQLNKIANGQRDSSLVGIGGMGVQLGMNLIDPIGLAMGFGVEAAATRVLAKTVFSGVNVTEKVAKMSLWQRTAKEAAEGVAGNLLEEALVVAPLTKQEQADYDADQAITFAVGAGFAFPALKGAMKKTVGLFRKNPVLGEKAMTLAQQQAESGMRVDTSIIEAQAKIDEIPNLKRQADELRSKETLSQEEVNRLSDIEKDIEEYSSLEIPDSKQATLDANDPKNDMFYDPEDDFIVNDSQDPLMGERDSFNQRLDNVIEDHAPAFDGLDEKNPLKELVESRKKELEEYDQVIKSMITCIGRAG